MFPLICSIVLFVFAWVFVWFVYFVCVFVSLPVLGCWWDQTSKLPLWSRSFNFGKSNIYLAALASHPLSLVWFRVTWIMDMLLFTLKFYRLFWSIVWKVRNQVYFLWHKPGACIFQVWHATGQNSLFCADFGFAIL